MKDTKADTAEAEKNYIVLNGKYFHKRGTDSYESPEPCWGTYKANRQTVDLFDISGNKFAQINAYGMICRASKRGPNQYFYQVACPEFLGGWDYPLSKQREEAHAVLEQCGIAKMRDERIGIWTDPERNYREYHRIGL